MCNGTCPSKNQAHILCFPKSQCWCLGQCSQIAGRKKLKSSLRCFQGLVAWRTVTCENLNKILLLLINKHVQVLVMLGMHQHWGSSYFPNEMNVIHCFILLLNDNLKEGPWILKCFFSLYAINCYSLLFLLHGKPLISSPFPFWIGLGVFLGLMLVLHGQLDHPRRFFCCFGMGLVRV